MYIVRWLMGHPIIATWVLAAVAILLAIGSGNKGDVAENISSEKPSIEKVETIVPSSISSVDKKSIEAVASKDSIEKATSLVDSSKTVVTKTLTGDVVKTTGAAAKKVVVEATSPPLESGLDNPVVKSKPVAKKELDTDSKNTATADLGQATSEEMLLMAREAYWNNGLDEAAQIYEKLIKIEPKVLEHRGELGNVYWRQGYPKKAAELYSEIAIPMIEEGGAERVANMIGFIGLFYPDRAAEIHKRIQSKK